MRQEVLGKLDELAADGWVKLGHADQFRGLAIYAHPERARDVRRADNPAPPWAVIDLATGEITYHVDHPGLPPHSEVAERLQLEERRMASYWRGERGTPLHIFDGICDAYGASPAVAAVWRRELAKRWRAKHGGTAA